MITRYKFFKYFLLTFLPFSFLNATTHIIQFGGSFGFAYSPNNISVAVGDTIQWQGSFALHPLSSTIIPSGTSGWHVSSGSTFSYVVAQPGTYNYQCDVHSTFGMVGSFTASSAVHLILFGGDLGENYSPNNLTAVVGDTIRWQGNFDLHPLSSTTIPSDALSWQVTTDTIFNYVVTIPGIYNYRCNFHFDLGMVGSFIVNPVLPAPDLISPANSSIGITTNPILRWKKTSGAVSYHIQVSTLSNFSTLIINDPAIIDTTDQVISLINGTNYLWRVRADNSVGSSNWSGVFSFTTIPNAPAATKPVYPDSGAVNQQTTIKLGWIRSASADSYHVQLSFNSLFSSIAFDNVVRDTFIIESGLIIDTTYYWRISAINTGGASPWTNIWAFNTNILAPIATNLLFPDSNALNEPTTISFRWLRSAQADSYQVQLSLDPLFVSIDYENIVPDTFIVKSNLIGDTTYYWRVRAKNNGGTSPWTSIWKFNTSVLSMSVMLSESFGWNIVSIPLKVVDGRKTAIFPSAISAAFAFDQQYAAKETLQNGIGYWLKFPVDENILLGGLPVSIESVNVHEGWNLIGSISTPVLVSNITSEPPNIITSNFFKYHNGYIIADTIAPGRGYWVKVNQAGKLILTSSGSMNLKNRITIVSTNEMPPAPPDGIVLSENIPLQYSLNDAYPNPFNPTTYLRYSLPSDSKTKLTIYNILGQNVQTLLDGIENAGYKSIELNLSTLPSGMYFYELDAVSISDPGKSFSQVKKMILLK
ncbi:MAG: T9SS type A sorting domain-containing protein [Ignavibacteriales bacterium]|nr:T9SS type A sorting domain-containing protein [Ignavibacteriales bacterium]